MRHSGRRLLSVMAVALAIAWLWSSAAALAAVTMGVGDRIALVIGNSKYKTLGAVDSAVGDADAIASALRQLEFKVTEKSNLGLREFRKVLSDFAKSAASSDTAVVFFSGQGFQLDGANYLVPIDAKLAGREAVGKEALALGDVIAKIEGDKHQTLVFLDASRPDPLPIAVRGKEPADGLAQMDAASGTFIASAAQPGQAASASAGEHSLFTTALLANLTTPGISISDMMIRVRNAVVDASGQAQAPWSQSALRSQFYFSPQQEESSALTEEDRDLLLSLDPALRKKFEAKFGIRIEPDSGSADAGGEPAAPQIPTLRPKLRITGVSAPESSSPTVALAAPKPLAGKLKIVPENFAAPEPPAKAEPPAAPQTANAEQLAAGAGEKPVAVEVTPPEPARKAEIAETSPVPLPTARPVDTLAPAGAAPADESQAEKLAALAPTVAEHAPEAALKGSSATANLAPSPAQPDAAPKALHLRPSESLGAADTLSGAEVERADVAAAEEAAPRADAAIRSPSDRHALAVASAVAPGSTLKPVAAKPSRIEGQEVMPAAEPAEPVANIADAVVPTAEQARQAAKAAAPAAQPATPEAETLIATAQPASSTPEAASALPPRTAPTLTEAPALPPRTAPTLTEAPEQPAGPAVQAPAAGAAPILTEAEPAAPAAEQPTEEKDVTVAALEQPTTQPGELVRPNVTLPEAAPPPPSGAAEAPAMDSEALARAVQTELTRLGCYRSGIDGQWGPNSARGLLRFFATKKEDPDDLDLNTALLTRLQNEDTVVCKQTETHEPKRVVRTREKAPTRVSERAPSRAVPEPSRGGGSGGGGGGAKKLTKGLSIGGFR